MNIGQETEQIELKKSTGELKEGIISLGSMLNKHGNGILYFGVKNNGDIIGQQIGDSTLREISQAIAVGIKPQVIPTISLVLMDEKNVVKIEANGEERPYSAYGRYYMRSADEDREILPAQLKKLMRDDQTSSIVTMDAEYDHLTFNQLKTLYANHSLTINTETFEQNTGLINKNGHYNLMAELLADDNYFSIKVARFAGTDKTELVMRNEYGYKCLLIAMGQALDYMEAINETRVTLSGDMVRKEESLFDFACFREAWINACLHNKWSSKTPPAIYIFSNRIEIISTGGLPPYYSEEEFFSGISHPVNVQLQKIMGQLDIVEQTGHGVPLIVKTYGREAFTITDHFITVTFPFTFSISRNKDEVITKSEDKVFRLIESDQHISIKNIAEQSQLSVPRVNQIIKQLKSMKKIERVGSKRSGMWVVL